MIVKPYTASTGSDNRSYVNGPGNGMGYNSGTLWPEMRFTNKDDATAAAKCCNEAYCEGYEKAQHDIRKALGIVIKRGN